jgi:Carbamoyl-phosphate synthase L chain, ATP binding domain
MMGDKSTARDTMKVTLLGPPQVQRHLNVTHECVRPKARNFGADGQSESSAFFCVFFSGVFFVFFKSCGVQSAGVPTVPGSEGLIKDEADAIKVAREVGFPVMIKATAGGGGRGMRLANEESEFLPLLRQAQQEAENAFGNGAVYLERFVRNPRHIEFQVWRCRGL